jgi:hypothetical protein
MPEPSPANTKITMEMNSASAAFQASGWLASAGDPIAILDTGIFFSFYLFLLYRNFFLFVQSDAEFSSQQAVHIYSLSL